MSVWVFFWQHMENEQEAQQAIRSLNGHILNGNRINVEVRASCFFDVDVQQFPLSWY